MPSVTVRRPFIHVNLGTYSWPGGWDYRMLGDDAEILSATVSRGLDQELGTATVYIVPPLPSYVQKWSDIDVHLGVDLPPLTSLPLPTTSGYCRIVGRVVGFDFSLFPSAVGIQIEDALTWAKRYFPPDGDTDLYIMTAREIVMLALRRADFPVVFYPGNFDGGEEWYSLLDLKWPMEQSSLDVILEVDESEAYRTYVTTEGILVRREVVTAPSYPPTWTLTEGVDILEGSLSFALLAPTSRYLVAEEAGLPVPTPATRAEEYEGNFEYASQGLARIQLTTWRQDIFEPGESFEIVSAHLAADLPVVASEADDDELGAGAGLYMLQSISTSVDEGGAFTQQLHLLGPTFNPGTAPPPVASQPAGIFLTTLENYGGAYYDDGVWTMFGAPLDTITTWCSCAAIPSDNPLRLYVWEVPTQTMLTSTDGAASFVPIATAATCGFSNTLSIAAPAEGQIYAAHTGGISRSLDGGATWGAVVSGSTRELMGMSATKLWYATKSGSVFTIHRCGWDGGGDASLLPTITSSALLDVNPTFDAIADDLALAWLHEAGLYLCTSTTTTEVTPPGATLVFSALAISATVLLCLSDDDPITLYRSTDAGASWTTVRTFSATEAPNANGNLNAYRYFYDDGTTVFLTGHADSPAGIGQIIWSSDDRGLTWTSVTNDQLVVDEVNWEYYGIAGPGSIAGVGR